MLPMLLRNILFPAPNPPHYSLTSHKNHLFWLPASEQTNGTAQIPCMLYSPTQGSNLLMIWCHGNGCDIGSMGTILAALSESIQTHIIAFEYPSYGLCVGPQEPNEETINHHAERVYNFVRDKLQWPVDRILIYGHSIGTGPACHIASTRLVSGLILQSPYTSLQNLVQEKIGIFSMFVNSPQWDNLQAMNRIQCPILLIHGQRDDLIPFHHSQMLFDSLTHMEKKRLVLLPDDDHNSIPVWTILSHLQSFLSENFAPAFGGITRIEMPLALLTPPPIFQQSTSQAPQ